MFTRETVPTLVLERLMPLQGRGLCSAAAKHARILALSASDMMDPTAIGR